MAGAHSSCLLSPGRLGSSHLLFCEWDIHVSHVLAGLKEIAPFHKCPLPPILSGKCLISTSCLWTNDQRQECLEVLIASALLAANYLNIFKACICPPPVRKPFWELSSMDAFWKSWTALCELSSSQSHSLSFWFCFSLKPEWQKQVEEGRLFP